MAELLLIAAMALLCILHGTHHHFFVDASIPRSTGSQVTSRRNHKLLQIKRKSFLWRASLESYTGVASSFEQSIFQFSGDGLILPNKDRINEFAREVFSNYPEFLQKPSLTLGLCRTVSTNTKDSDLRTSFLPLNLLTFGQPRVVSSKHCIRNNETAQSRDKITGCGEVLCCIEIPILGGLLANQDSTSPESNKKPKHHDQGCLRFSWLQIKNLPQSKIILVTEISGNYKPSLAGRKLPIPTWRNIMYCSTQRLLHAYVMWRFHGFVVKEYRSKIDG